MRRFISLGAVLAIVLAGCGGGGGGSSSLPSIPAKGAGSEATASVALTLKIPSKSAASSVKRAPNSISPATQSIGVAVNGGAPQVFNATPTSNGCALVGN